MIVDAGPSRINKTRRLQAYRCWHCGWTGPARSLLPLGRRLLALDAADHLCADYDDPA